MVAQSRWIRIAAVVALIAVALFAYGNRTLAIQDSEDKVWFGPVGIWQQPLYFGGLLVGVVVVLALTFVAMWLSTPLMRLLGVTGANVANRLLGVVLGALAVQFIIDGVRAVFNLA